MAKLIKKYRELITFCIIGFIMTALNMVLLSLLVETLHINYIVSNIVAYMFVVILSYIINIYVTFKQTKFVFKQEITKLLKYLIMKTMLLGLDCICLYFMHEKMLINLYISKIVLTIIFTLVSFTFSKTIILDKKNSKSKK